MGHKNESPDSCKKNKVTEDSKQILKTNILYRWVFKANHHSRLWELEIYTTGELTVPEYRLPSQKTQKIKEKSKKQPEPKRESTSIRENVVEEGENLFADLDVVDEDDPEWDEDFFEDFDSM